MNRIRIIAISLVLAFVSGGCSSFVSRFILRSFEQIGAPVDSVQNRIAEPIRPGTHLSVLWIGHASFLLQMDDKVILTDPVFVNTVALLAKRTVEAGLDPHTITHADLITISHLHFDHFNYRSLGMLPKNGALVLPKGGAEYAPEFGFAETKELAWWDSFEFEGIRVTSVPVQHFSGRYGFDAGWMDHLGYTGYIVQYHGMTIFIAGDTAYNPDLFKEIGRRFRIDLALIPIGPIGPQGMMSRVHANPEGAVRIFQDLGARYMIPMHFETFFQTLDSTQHEARNRLEAAIAANHLENRIFPLHIGEQRDLSHLIMEGIEEK